MGRYSEAGMGDYDQVHFRGTFRDCQQRVLDRAQDYLRDGKLNIVAAPGSGKTVLGLELIRRLGAPCLILSPTGAIRRQWGDRLRDLFLDDPRDFGSLFSEDLHRLRTVNSITYQALYSAVEKIPAEGTEDFSDVDLIVQMRERGIRTVCLDEAHHLRNEWYRALEAFLRALDRDVTVISLTATPPYDADGPEWRRYRAICGEIDEEIFIPELVAQHTLCPHQDYILLNYPTENELAVLRDHTRHAAAALEELGTTDLLAQAYCTLRDQADPALLPGDEQALAALLGLLDHFGYSFDRRRIRAMTGRRPLPPWRPETAEAALQYLLDGDLLDASGRDALASLLKNHGLYDRHRVSLVLTDRLKRMLVGSAGKLDSIARIVRSERDAMGDRLRMLILTDHIRRESLSGIADRDRFRSVSVASIFETLRRAVPEAQIGVLSGSLVILPESVEPAGCDFTSNDIPGTGYRTVSFGSSLHSAVEAIGALLDAGTLQILIGTRSLLGEGWDSPCVNTLILASTVGSFVSSNQMRGRAIRTDPHDPQKTANIWHLATVTPEELFSDVSEPQPDPELLSSYDFSVLVRRFDAFMGPNDATGEIESGFERLTVIRPPFDRAGVERINRDMLALSARRTAVPEQWAQALAVRPVRTELETRVQRAQRLPVLTLRDGTGFALLAGLAVGLIRPLSLALAHGLAALSFGMIGVLCAAAYGLFQGAKLWFRHRSPTRSIQSLGTAVYQALCRSGQISPASALEADSGPDCVCLRLHGASVHDQNVFNTAVTELLSPIGDPRYVLIVRTVFGRFRWERAFACPSALGKTREDAALLAEALKKTAGRFAPVYTRTEEGRRLLRKCRRLSYVCRRDAPVEKKYRIAKKA